MTLRWAVTGADLQPKIQTASDATIYTFSAHDVLEISATYLCDRTLQFDVLKVSVGKMLLLKAIADALQPDEATKIEIRREETSNP